MFPQTMHVFFFPLNKGMKGAFKILDLFFLAYNIQEKKIVLSFIWCDYNF